MIRSTKALTASAYIAMFFLGVSGSLVGALARNIGLSAVEIGLLIAIQNTGFIIAVSISGALADSIQKPRLLLVGSLIMAMSLFAFYATDIFWLNMMIMFLNGAGIGVFEGVTDAMLIDLHEENASLQINVNHFFVTFGSIIIAIFLTYLQDDWRQAIVIAGIAVMLLSLLFFISRMEVKPHDTDRYSDRMKVLSREQVILYLFAGTILVVGAEAASIGMMTTYLMYIREFTQVTSKIGLTIFLVGIAVGRLLVGYLTKREHIIRNLIGMFGLSTIIYGVLYLFDLGTITYGAIFLAGLGISAILPLIISLAGVMYSDIAGLVVGAIKIAIPIGGMLIPLLISFAASRFSLQAAMIIFPAIFLAGTLLMSYGLRGRRVNAEIL